ncbi:MAG: YggU family protein [Nitrospirae bacterium]|nr:YggU family protein [Nitrospirota bacterium]
MPDIPSFDLREMPDGLLFKVSVQPRASREELAGIRDRALRLRLTVPPIEGAANEACRAFFAEFFHVARERVRIIRGHHSRQKWIQIQGVTQKMILDRLKSVDALTMI